MIEHTFFPLDSLTSRLIKSIRMPAFLARSWTYAQIVPQLVTAKIPDCPSRIWATRISSVFPAGAEDRPLTPSDRRSFSSFKWISAPSALARLTIFGDVLSNQACSASG